MSKEITANTKRICIKCPTEYTNTPSNQPITSMMANK